MTKGVGRKAMRLARLFAATCVPLLAAMTGCSTLGASKEVTVVVFNYNPQPIADLVIADQAIPGYEDSYRPGSAGGGSVCCIAVKPGEVEVRWVYGGEEGALKAGQTDRAVGLVPRTKGGHAYLGVHLYPGSKVEFTLTPYVPREKAQGVALE